MSVDHPMTIAAPLLDWYRANARALPWRSPPGTRAPDPYRVWLSEVMLQQTTVAAVKPYFAAFTTGWPTVEALGRADDASVMAAWAGLGYYARARNLLACARAVTNDHGGRFPDEEAALHSLPGIGRYTAAAIAAIAFGRRAVVVDGNVERVVARLFGVDAPMPGAKAMLFALAESITPQGGSGDFAQAMMDLGATLCTPRAPACGACPLRRCCAGFASGSPDRFPLRPPRRARPERRGTAFWLEAQGRVLLVRRPASGLLGGMRALPSGPWSADDPGLAGAPGTYGWREAGRVSHIFTHFALDLAVMVAEADGTPHCAGEWWPIDMIDDAGLPSLFARAASIARADRLLPIAAVAA